MEKKKGQAKVRMRQRDKEGALVQQCKIAPAYSVKNAAATSTTYLVYPHMSRGEGWGETPMGDKAAYTFPISRACRVLLIKGLLNSVPAPPNKR